MRSTGTVLGKRTMIELSHAIERFALAAEPGRPLVVIAMFQKLSYFHREVAVYREIAGREAVTIVGLAEDVAHERSDGVAYGLVGADDVLAREWSVTVLGPKGGATLVAIDQEEIDPTARTLEGGRRFRGSWSFRRADAYGEVLRLRTQLRLPPGTVDRVDAVLRAVLDEPEPRRQEWWEVPLLFLGDRMDGAVRARSAATAALAAVRDDTGDRDPRTGFHTPAFLRRWTAGLGNGTLPIGVILLRVFDVALLRERYGLRAELAVLQGLRSAITALVGDADRLIRVGQEDFLVVLPSWLPDDVVALRDRVFEGISTLDQVYPFVALSAVAAATVTRDRPLPVEQLRQRIDADQRLTAPA